MMTTISAQSSSIHGAFGGLTFTPLYAVPAPSAASPRAAAFAQLPNISVPNGHGCGRGRGLPARSAAASSLSSGPVEIRIPTARRAPPPPPIRLPRAVPRTPAEDPFADGESSCTHPEAEVLMAEDQARGPIIISLPPPPRHRPRSCSASVSPPPLAPPADAVSAAPAPAHKRPRGRLVASVLLSRGCGYGRPMRRPLGGTREYVKSGLSCVVECA